MWCDEQVFWILEDPEIRRRNRTKKAALQESLHGFTPTCGNDPIWLYNIFQMGWNHELVWDSNMKFCQLCQTKKVLVPVGIAPIFQPRWPTAIPSRENMSGTAAMVFFFNSFEVGGEGNGGGHPYVVYIVHIYIYEYF